MEISCDADLTANWKTQLSNALLLHAKVHRFTSSIFPRYWWKMLIPATLEHFCSLRLHCGIRWRQMEDWSSGTCYQSECIVACAALMKPLFFCSCVPGLSQHAPALLTHCTSWGSGCFVSYYLFIYRLIYFFCFLDDYSPAVRFHMSSLCDRFLQGLVSLSMPQINRQIPYIRSGKAFYMCDCFRCVVEFSAW